MSGIASNLSTRASPARRAGIRALSFAIGAALLCGGVAVAATTIARGPVRAASPKPTSPKPTSPEPTFLEPASPKPMAEHWIAIAKPVRIYDLEAPAFRGLPATYTARRHALGGGREDTLVLGALSGTAPMLRFSAFRRADEAADAAPLATALARLAADAGLTRVEEGPFRPDVDQNPRRGQGEGITTRFGRVEVAGLVLSGGGRLVSCDGFRLALDRPAFAVTGLACAAYGRPMPRRTLACLIERLDLASARDDRDLIDFFAASELRRDAGCAGMGLGPNAVHAASLDDISDTLGESLRRR